MKFEQRVQCDFKRGYNIGWKEGFDQNKTNDKIEFTKQILSTLKDSNIPNGRRIQDLELLSTGISKCACCKFCNGDLILIKENNIRGLSSSLIWQWDNCKKETSIP